MRVVMVHNHKAGDEEHSAAALVQLASRAGHAVTCFSSKDDRWKRALDSSVELVAAAGGDGTVEEVARELVGRSLPLAVLPLGTANNISSALGQQDMPLEALVAGWTRAVRRPFDLGVARGPFGTHYFLESVGAGLIAVGIAAIRAGRSTLAEEADRRDDRLTAARSAFEQVLDEIGATSFEVTLDGRDRSGDYLLIEALNFGVAGPRFLLSHHGNAADGLLDVVLVEDGHRHDFAQHLSRSKTDPAARFDLPVEQARHVRLACDGCLFHLDDRLWEKPHQPAPPIIVDLAVEPHALTMLAPLRG